MTAMASLLGSPIMLAVIILTAFVALFIVFWMLLGTGARLRRDREIATRMRAAGRVPGAKPEARNKANSAVAWLPTGVVDFGGKVATKVGFSENLGHRLEQAGLPLTTGEFVTITVLAGFAGGIVGAILLQNIVFVMAVAAAAAIVPTGVMKLAIRRRVTRLHNQLPDVLTILASSLRAGHSFLQALDTVAKEIPEPGAEEFNRAVAEIRLGRPVEDALQAMADRVDNEDFQWAVMAVNIQREVGGNLAEILDTVADTVRERATIRRQVDVLTTEGKVSSYVLIALPFGIALYMATVNPDYIGLLFTTSIGRIMLIGACCLMAAGIYWMRRIVKIDV